MAEESKDEQPLIAQAMVEPSFFRGISHKKNKPDDFSVKANPVHPHNKRRILNQLSAADRVRIVKLAAMKVATE